jgi:hypothetical protein
MVPDGVHAIDNLRDRSLDGCTRSKCAPQRARARHANKLTRIAWDVPKTKAFSAIPGTMSVARFAHTATLLNDGTVMIAGGFNAGYNANSSVEKYDPTTNSFSQMSSGMQVARAFHQATTLADGRVLLSGGSCCVYSPQAIGTAEIYDPATGSFTATPGTPNVARFKHTATLLYDGTVLLAGGATNPSQAATSSGEIYNPTTGQFTPTTSLSSSRYSHTATLLNDGSVFFAGGWQGSGSNVSPQANSEMFSTPYVTGNVNPKYVVLSVFYAPPGAQSFADYLSTTAVGTSNSVTNSFQTSESVGISFGDKISLFGTDHKYTLTFTSSFSQQNDSTNTVAINATSAYDYKVRGPSNSALGISHDSDVVAIWLNPVLQFTLGTNGSVIWNGYRYDSRDNNSTGMDIVYLTVGQLKNPASITNPTTLSYLQRSWDTSGLGGLTYADYATILGRDPYGNSTPSLDTTRYSSDVLNQNLPYGPTGPCPAQPSTATFTGSYQTVTSQSTGTTDTYQVGYSIDTSSTIFKTISLGLKNSTNWTWTTKTSHIATTTTSNSATGQITGPLCTDNYNGPTNINLYRDTVYGTFLFVGAP